MHDLELPRLGGRGVGGVGIPGGDAVELQRRLVARCKYGAVRCNGVGGRKTKRGQKESKMKRQARLRQLEAVMGPTNSLKKREGSEKFANWKIHDAVCP